MKKYFALILTFILVFTAVSCGSTKNEPTIPEENILHVSGMLDAKETLEEVYDYADYVVICEVTEKEDSYLSGGKQLDTSLPQDEIMEQLIAVRTPYEITIKESYKGNLEIGSAFTVVSLEGELNGYALDAGLPDLEVGKTYFMPICISDPDEYIPYFPSLATIASEKKKSSTGTAEVVPMMFDAPFENIQNLDSLREVLTDLENK